VDSPKRVSGIILEIRDALSWGDVPEYYGPDKSIYKRFIRWSRLDVFNKILA
jgi:putative transposase